MRLRTTALPTFLVTVKPTRAASLSPRSSTSSRKSRPRRFSPRRTARNSARLRSLAGAGCGACRFPATESPSLRRRAACGRDCGERRRRRGHPWWPCGHGNHAGACGRVWTADRYASFVLIPRRAALLDSVTDATGALPGDLWRNRKSRRTEGPSVRGLIERRGLEVNRRRGSHRSTGRPSIALLPRRASAGVRYREASCRKHRPCGRRPYRLTDGPGARRARWTRRSKGCAGASCRSASLLAGSAARLRAGLA